MKRWCSKCRSIITMTPHTCNVESRPGYDNGNPFLTAPSRPVRSNWFHQVDPVGFGFMAIFLSGAVLWRWLQ